MAKKDLKYKCKHIACINALQINRPQNCTKSIKSIRRYQQIVNDSITVDYPDHDEIVIFLSPSQNVFISRQK